MVFAHNIVTTELYLHVCSLENQSSDIKKCNLTDLILSNSRVFFNYYFRLLHLFRSTKHLFHKRISNNRISVGSVYRSTISISESIFISFKSEMLLETGIFIFGFIYPRCFNCLSSASVICRFLSLAD